MDHLAQICDLVEDTQRWTALQPRIMMNEDLAWRPLRNAVSIVNQLIAIDRQVADQRRTYDRIINHVLFLRQCHDTIEARIRDLNRTLWVRLYLDDIIAFIEEDEQPRPVNSDTAPQPTSPSSPSSTSSQNDHRDYRSVTIEEIRAQGIADYYAEQVQELVQAEEQPVSQMRMKEIIDEWVEYMASTHQTIHEIYRSYSPPEPGQVTEWDVMLAGQLQDLEEN